jgi:hypothetical protein
MPSPTPDLKSDPSATPTEFAKHSRVRHPDYGRGYVVEVRGENCTVFFLEDGKRRDLKQTKLEPCS